MSSDMLGRDGKTKYCMACNRAVADQFSHCPQDGTLLVESSLVSEEELIGTLTQRYELSGRIDSHNTINFLLSDRELNRKVVAKVLRLTATFERDCERFERMAETLKKLNHPGIPKLIGQGNIREFPYLLLEFKEGQTLQALVKDRGKMKVTDVCKIFIQVCATLRHAHDRSIFHQELTAKDIICKENKDQKWEVAVIDFGKGKPLIHGDNRAQQLTEKGDIFGSAAVLAPEIFLGTQSVDALSNIYSIGCIMYFAVSGKYPYQAPNWMAVLHKHANSMPAPIFSAGYKTNADRKIEEVILRAMSKERDKRFENLTSLSKALQEVME